MWVPSGVINHQNRQSPDLLAREECCVRRWNLGVEALSTRDKSDDLVAISKALVALGRKAPVSSAMAINGLDDQ